MYIFPQVTLFRGSYCFLTSMSSIVTADALANFKRGRRYASNILRSSAHDRFFAFEFPPCTTPRVLRTFPLHGQRLFWPLDLRHARHHVEPLAVMRSGVRTPSGPLKIKKSGHKFNSITVDSFSPFDPWSSLAALSAIACWRGHLRLHIRGVRYDRLHNPFGL